MVERSARFFSAGNLSIYWREEDIGKNWTERQFIGPDFFVVLDVERRPRNSWMVSLENGRFPNVTTELWLKSTARKDHTAKKALYHNVFKAPEYFWFHPDPQKQEFRGFRPEDGLTRKLRLTPRAGAGVRNWGYTSVWQMSNCATLRQTGRWFPRLLRTRCSEARRSHSFRRSYNKHSSRNMLNANAQKN